MEDYILTHLGDGLFYAKVGDDGIKEVGSNLCSMIMYTYFDNGTLPKIGWEVTRQQLLTDYLPKMQKDVLSGKLKANQTNYY